MSPHHPGKRLVPDGADSAPKGSLRSGGSFFARLLQPFLFISGSTWGRGGQYEISRFWEQDTSS